MGTAEQISVQFDGASDSARDLIARLSRLAGAPTLLLAVFAPSCMYGLIALGFAGILPLWVCTAPIALLSYAHYTLVHESIHGNFARGRPRWRFLYDVVGWVGAIGMDAAWPALRRTHLLHHAHTNTDQDPDIYVKGSFLALLGKGLMRAFIAVAPMWVFRIIAPRLHAEIRKIIPGNELIQSEIASNLTLGLLIAALAFHRLPEFFWLWFLPVRLGWMMMHIFFQWLPHHPFDRTDRLGNARISLWPGGEFVSMCHNLHLVHHLWPSVPFYHYPTVFKAMRSQFETQGVRIEGLILEGGPVARGPDRSAA